jgi:hypothetical protein
MVYATVNIAYAAPIGLVSPARQAMLLELYTSEGCSSCPPADRWLSQFKTDARLWHEIVPVAFHVDYWNYLGWQDRFSDAKYTARQQNYYRHHYLKGVYTPGFVNNGREWRDWFGLRRLPQPAVTDVGVLKALIDHAAVTVEFMPTSTMPAPLVLNVAYLGFTQTTVVAGGENSGKELVHDFVALDVHQFPETAAEPHHRWAIKGPSVTAPAHATGIALWITAGDDPTPLQATGGWLGP